jgi:hypothetical protein
LKISARLRRFHDPECGFATGNRQIDIVVATDLQEKP